MKTKLSALLVVVTIVATTAVVIAQQTEPPLAPGLLYMSINAGPAIAGQNFDIYGQVIATVYMGEGNPPTQVPQSGFTVTLKEGAREELSSVIGTAVSDANGNCRFTLAKPSGTYHFAVNTTYTFGSDPDGKPMRFGAGTGLDVTVIDSSQGSAKTPTTLDVFSPLERTITAKTGGQFTITGWLTSDSAISGSVILQQWDGSTWKAVKSTPTDAQGRCTFTHSINALGTYYVRMHYEGSPTNAQSSSEFIKLSVR